jgi:hypothetical protein
MKRAFLILSVLSTSLWCNLSAQPQLNFKRVVIERWPDIELYFRATCDSQPVWFTSRSNFEVKENGKAVGNFDLWCPDAIMDPRISAALVFDASASMAGAGNAGAKAGGHAFIDYMDGICDETAVVWYNSMVTGQQGMTTSKDLLHAAVNSLPASGNTAVWDGVYFGLLELINNGVNMSRGMVVLTDGMDNSSSRTPAEIIPLANRNRIRIYTIALGGGPVNSAQLKAVAEMTGGRYYEIPGPSGLEKLYQDLYWLIFGDYDCLIAYKASCADGSAREVELSLVNYCNGSDTKTKSYTAPRDTLTFKRATIRPGSIEGIGKSDVLIPITLITPLPSETIFPAVFNLEYDTSLIRFKSVTTQGTLLDGIDFVATTSGTSVVLQSFQEKTVLDWGPLLNVMFTLSDPPDTVRAQLTLSNWYFSRGCIQPVLENGMVMILPRTTNNARDILEPAAFRLNQNHPNPFTGSTTIPFSLSTPAHIRIRIFDALGRQVRTIADEWRDSGQHCLVFDATGLPPGVYTCRMEAGRTTISRKMIIN